MLSFESMFCKKIKVVWGPPNYPWNNFLSAMDMEVGGNRTFINTLRPGDLSHRRVSAYSPRQHESTNENFSCLLVSKLKTKTFMTQK